MVAMPRGECETHAVNSVFAPTKEQVEVYEREKYEQVESVLQVNKLFSRLFSGRGFSFVFSRCHFLNESNFFP